MKAKPKPGRKPRTPLNESAIYDGSRLLGLIVPKDGEFIAKDEAGKRLGTFATDRLAMKAIFDATRELREVRAAE